MNKNIILTRFIIAIAILPMLFPFAPFAHAAALTSLSDTMTSQKISTVSNHDVSFTTPTGITSGQTVTLTFQSDFSIAAALDFTDIDVLVAGTNVTLAASPTGATWGAVRTSSTVITLTNGTTAVSAGSVVRIKIGTNATNQSTGVRQITNPTTTGNKTLTLGGTAADSGTITIPILTDDQVAVSATVGQTLAFTITDNSIGFGTLSSSASTYATGDTLGTASETSAHSVTASTNATSGYTVALSGATLTSTPNTIDPIAAGPTALSAGSEQFGIRATASGGTGTVAARYAGAAGNYGFGSSPLSSQTFASSTTSTGTTTYALFYGANVSTTTEAGSYSTALTYNATANF